MARGATRKSGVAWSPDRVVRWLRAGLNALLLASLVAAGVWSWRWLTDPVNWPVGRVEISGDLTHVDRQQLQARLGQEVAEGFLHLSVVRVAAAVERLPWVARAVVKRRWPNGLLVQVTEQQAVARWGEEGLLNRDGEVFVRSGGDLLPGLPQLIGPDAATRDFYRQYTQLSAVLLAMGLPRPNRARLTTGGELRLDLPMAHGRGTLLLTVAAADAQRKVHRFARVWQYLDEDQRRQAAAVDLRYPQGMAVRWRKASGSTAS